MYLKSWVQTPKEHLQIKFLNGQHINGQMMGKKRGELPIILLK